MKTSQGLNRAFVTLPAWFWGDPHLRTLDGIDYTYNGLGEYTVALLDDESGQRYFELQGRTQRAFNSETQQLSEATFFAAFAAEAVDAVQVVALAEVAALAEVVVVVVAVVAGYDVS